MTRQLYTCPHCGDVLSSPPRFYSCPARPGIEPAPLSGEQLPLQLRSRPRRQRVSRADVIRLRTGDLANIPQRDAAEQLGISIGYVYNIRAGTARKDVE